MAIFKNEKLDYFKFTILLLKFNYEVEYLILNLFEFITFEGILYYEISIIKIFKTNENVK